MNSFFIYICVKPTVFKLLYGSYPPDTSHRFIKISKQHTKNRTVCSNLICSNTSGTPKILKYEDSLENLYIDLLQEELAIYHILVILNNCFCEQKVSGIFSKIKETFPKSSQRFYLAQTLTKTQKHI